MRPSVVRVLIVESDPSVSRGWGRLLSVSGHASDFSRTVSDGLDRLRGSRFDVIIVDESLPGGGWFPIVRAASEINPRPGVCITTGFTESDAIKDYSSDLPNRVIVIPKVVLPYCLRYIIGSLQCRGTLQRSVGVFKETYSLSPREVEVIERALDLDHDKLISDRLGCTYSTVRFHWRRIREKLGCSSQRDVLSLMVRFFHNKYA